MVPNSILVSNSEIYLSKDIVKHFAQIVEQIDPKYDEEENKDPEVKLNLINMVRPVKIMTLGEGYS